MSAYQFLAFRAVDRPQTDRDLAYARKQSSRAEITRWYFENEYHYGDFRGDANGLLRHGYDVHLHYANFGLRMIRTGIIHKSGNDVGTRSELPPNAEFQIDGSALA